VWKKYEINIAKKLLFCNEKSISMPKILPFSKNFCQINETNTYIFCQVSGNPGYMVQ